MAELTPRQAYEVLIHFLKAVRLRTRSSDVNALLDLLQFLGDDLPVDPALWETWIANVRAAGQPLTEERAFSAAARFLTGYQERGRSPALVELIADMRGAAGGSPANSALWQEWRIAVQRALSPHERAEAHSGPPPPRPVEQVAPAESPGPTRVTQPLPPPDPTLPARDEHADAALFDSPARYSRQAILPGIGAAGQARIRAGRVAILGLGARDRPWRKPWPAPGSAPCAWPTATCWKPTTSSARPSTPRPMSPPRCPKPSPLPPAWG